MELALIVIFAVYCLAVFTDTAEAITGTIAFLIDLLVVPMFAAFVLACVAGLVMLIIKVEIPVWMSRAVIYLLVGWLGSLFFYNGLQNPYRKVKREEMDDENY